MTITLSKLAEFLDIDPRHSSFGVALGVQRKFGKWHARLTGPGLEVVNTAESLEDAVIGVVELYSTKRKTKR